jgi:hypothetical protein
MCDPRGPASSEEVIVQLRRGLHIRQDMGIEAGQLNGLALVGGQHEGNKGKKGGMYGLRP